jgi:hypothetical protein
MQQTDTHKTQTKSLDMCIYRHVICRTNLKHTIRNSFSAVLWRHKKKNRNKLYRNGDLKIDFHKRYRIPWSSEYNWMNILS